MKNKRSILRGIKSSILASLCCLTPLVAVLAGIGSISIALSFLRYRPYFLILGFIFLSLATYVHIKRDYGKCSYSAIKKERYSIIISVISMILVYVFLTYFLIPPILISKTENIIYSSVNNEIDTEEMKVRIEGMTCSCNVADIEYNIMQINGVVNASVNYDTKIGTIKYDPKKTNQEAIIKSEILSSSYKAVLVW